MRAYKEGPVRSVSIDAIRVSSSYLFRMCVCYIRTLCKALRVDNILDVYGTISILCGRKSRESISL